MFLFEFFSCIENNGYIVCVLWGRIGDKSFGFE